MKQNTSHSKVELGKKGNELEEEEGMGRVVKQWNDREQRIMTNTYKDFKKKSNISYANLNT